MTRLRAFAFAAAVTVLGVPWAADAASPIPTSPGVVQGEKSEKTEPTPTLPTQVKTGPSGSLDETYASREASAKGLETFEGGHSGVYIGGGAVTVLLIVLLIVIIL